jgi:hypothetical protein
MLQEQRVTEQKAPALVEQQTRLLQRQHGTRAEGACSGANSERDSERKALALVQLSFFVATSAALLGSCVRPLILYRYTCIISSSGQVGKF